MRKMCAWTALYENAHAAFHVLQRRDLARRLTPFTICFDIIVRQLSVLGAHWVLTHSKPCPCSALLSKLDRQHKRASVLRYLTARRAVA